MTEQRPDRTDLDREEAEKFRLIRRFTRKCRERWPGAKIVFRSSDSVSVDLKGPWS